MVSKSYSSIKPKPTNRPIESWLKKFFSWKSKEMPANPDIDRRDFSRLVIDSQNSLDLCLSMQDERVFCTNIRDLSASGLCCKINGLSRIQNKQPITALFVLPMEEPRIIKTEIFLVSVLKGDDEEDLFRFRFSEETRDSTRDLIHRYIVLKQFETLERIN